MHKYELTERGKIIIAILVVLLFLVLPAAILAYKAWAAGPQAPPPSHSTEATGTPPPSLEYPPQISESPPPNGGGFNPPNGYPSNGNGNGNGHGNGNGGQESSRPPEFGPTGGTPSEGTLTFLFSPHLQNTLDAETLSVLGVFLSSPNNTPNSQIAVEMPKLSGEDAEKLVSAIVNAFAALGVRENKLAFIVNTSGEAGAAEGESAVEVNLSFMESYMK